MALALAFGGSLAVCCLAADEGGAEFFEARVRPILSARCFECHSGQAAKPKGGLRLDSREAALRGGDTGPALVPGKPQDSLLIDAVNYGMLYQMPPKSRMPADEIVVLTKWVEMGAPWGQEPAAASAAPGRGDFDLAKRQAEHWCWQPITRPQAPQIPNLKSKIQNEIDAFIVARLLSAGLGLSKEAEPATLLRRLHFDLVGVPPTVEDIDSFESQRPDWYERLADKLLSSPRFGERWARHWLDLVRYAESRGHEFDYEIPNAFEYRDYVIRALNADVPYDQFVVEHVAGDLLEQPRLQRSNGANESILGSGFWFLGEWCHSPVDIRKDECDRLDNMLDVFSKTFLGVTVACARCHDHKFDAISQRDYYALAGFLQSSSYRLTRFETWSVERRIAAGLAAIETKFRPAIAAAIAAAMRPRASELADLLLAGAHQSEAGVADCELNGATVIVNYQDAAAPWMTDGPTFGPAPVRAGQLVLDGPLPLEMATYGAARRDLAWGNLGLANVSTNDPGRLGSWLRAGRTLKTPKFTLASGYVHYLIEGVGQVYAAVDSHAMLNGPLHGELTKETGGNSDLPMRWITHDLSRYIGQRVHLEFSPKDEEDFRVLLVVEGAQRPAAPHQRPNSLLARADRAEHLRVVHETLDLLATDGLAVAPLPRDRAAIAAWLIDKSGLTEALPAELGKTLADYKRERDECLESLRAESRLCLAMWDGTPVDENVLIRGNPKTVGPVVGRRMLEAVGGTGDREQGTGSSGRLELARRLVERDNPLVSRVIVNRVWQHLLGRGIVPSVDNFGVLGQTPTHPELLDYLAATFMDESWSIKRTVRRIVTSNTYRQETGDRGQGTEDVDPQNLLFHRQNIKRLEGETIRDAILAVSGELDSAMFGPSVPVYLTPFMQGRGRPKESGPLDGAGRRSIYGAVRRNFLSPMMLAFDTPIPFTTMGRRNVSNVPAQALTLMNDSFVAEQAQRWARKVVAQAQASPQARIRLMYLAAFAREPSTAENSQALAFLAQQASEYGLSPGQIKDDERIWADLGHILFNVKEFIFIE